MEHVYEVRQLAPRQWSAACVTHMTASVSKSEAQVERDLLGKCAMTEIVIQRARIVDTRSEETKMRDQYGTGEEYDDG